MVVVRDVTYRLSDSAPVPYFLEIVDRRHAAEKAHHEVVEL
jgi:hypothetical protein